MWDVEPVVAINAPGPDRAPVVGGPDHTLDLGRSRSVRVRTFSHGSKNVVRAVAVMAAVAAVAAAVLTTGLFSGAAGAAATPSPPACAAGTTVQTHDGPVCGIVASNYREWLGIPYAAPPVGSLRWRPPQPPAKWTSALQATREESPCPQSGISTDEDCLYVDVIVPSNVGSGPLPVLVHIHGGGFQGGSNSVYDKIKLATDGHVIVVGIQYRLGILGFLAESAFEAHAGDYGLEDQQAALRWVRHNIAAFGGDPGNVTIIGDSAGGSSMCDQIASPTAAGLFKKVISISGEYNSLLGAPTSLQPQDCKATLPTESQADATGASFAASVGCGQASDVASCLRSVPVQTLLTTAGGTNSPIINGTTLTTQLQKAFASGAVNRVRAIMGVDRDEDLTGTATTAGQYRQLVRTQYGALAPRILALYPLASYGSPFIAYRTVAADSNTVCPALVRDRRLSRWIRVYAYEGDDTDAPPSSFEGTTNPGGAFHVDELGFLFPGVFGITTNYDADQQALGNQIFAEFTAFARTGDPNTAGTPNWPEFNTRRPRVMSMQPAGDSELMSTRTISAEHNCGFWNAVSPRP
jgi:para-nitrobenzyl esterase